MRFFNDYDMFNVGETWYMVKEDDIYDDNGKLHHFDAESEVVIKNISKESGYGMAIVEIEGHKTHLGLDELYDLVLD